MDPDPMQFVEDGDENKNSSPQDAAAARARLKHLGRDFGGAVGHVHGHLQSKGRQHRPGHATVAGQ